MADINFTRADVNAPAAAATGLVSEIIYKKFELLQVTVAQARRAQL
jgi:hypothetical protein